MSKEEGAMRVKERIAVRGVEAIVWMVVRERQIANRQEWQGIEAMGPFLTRADAERARADALAEEQGISAESAKRR